MGSTRDVSSNGTKVRTAVSGKATDGSCLERAVATMRFHFQPAEHAKERNYQLTLEIWSCVEMGECFGIYKSNADVATSLYVNLGKGLHTKCTLFKGLLRGFLVIYRPH